MNLVIVESPTKSKTIEKFLGKNYTVRASMGHLRDLPKSTFGVDIENNFEPEYVVVPDHKRYVDDIKREMKKAEAVYFASDPDREGEAIAWHMCHLLDINPNEANRITKTR